MRWVTLLKNFITVITSFLILPRMSFWRKCRVPFGISNGEYVFDMKMFTEFRILAGIIQQLILVKALDIMS